MEQADFLRRVLETLERQEVVYMLVGSLASGMYGEPRFTRDIDIVLELTMPQAERLCAAFPPPDFYVSLAAARQALSQHGQFNVIHPASGNKADLIVARRDAWGNAQLARRQQTLVLPDRRGFIASREDVILGKLWYYVEGGSEKHLRDVTGILAAGGVPVDRAYVAHWAERLGLREAWRAVLQRLEPAS